MTENNLIADTTLHRTARVMSAVFNPLAIPLLAFIVLFAFSYLRIMPMEYKLIMLGVVLSFTVLLPAATIYIFQKISGLTANDLHQRKHRFAPLLLTITSYVLCLVTMRRMNIPWYMTGIILTALLIMVASAVVNLRWKLSEHTAGSGAIVGGLVAFSELFGYNPVWWLCLFILIAGAVGTARIILNHHSLGEVLGGFLAGFLCALLSLHPVTNLLTRLLLF